MPGPIDIAYVEILPDLKNFEKKIVKDIEQALKAADRKADKSAESIGKSISDSVKQGVKASQGSLAELSNRIRRAGGKVDVKIDIDDGELKRLSLRISDIGDTVTSSLKSIGKGTGSSLGKSLGMVLGPALGALAFQAFTLVSAVGPAVVALGASLPAAAAIGAAGIGTLQLAFLGLDEAIKNFDDNKKFQEALKNLSPAAAKFAVELRNLVPSFKAIRNAAQEGFFGTIGGQLTSFVNTLRGPLVNGFNLLGKAIGEVTIRLGNVFKSQQGLETLNAVFAFTKRVIDDAGPSLAQFAQGLLALAREALPFVRELFTLFTGFLGKIGVDLSEAAESGKLKEFFDEAIFTLTQLGTLALNVAGIIKSLFSSGKDSGNDFLTTLIVLTGQMNALLSQKGAVEGLGIAFRALGLLLLIPLNNLIIINNVARSIGESIRDAGRAISEFVRKSRELFEGRNQKGGGLFGRLGIPGLQTGGVVTGPTVIGAGEAGNELVLPLTGQHGRRAIRSLSDGLQSESASLSADMSPNGVRRWSSGPQVVQVNLTVDSGGSKMDELLVQLLRKAIRIQGGNVQQVLGQTVGGVA